MTMSRSSASGAHSAIGARRRRTAGAVIVAALPSHTSTRAARCGTHFRRRGAAPAAVINGSGRRAFDVASRRYTRIGTRTRIVELAMALMHQTLRALLVPAAAPSRLTTAPTHIDCASDIAAGDSSPMFHLRLRTARRDGIPEIPFPRIRRAQRSRAFRSGTLRSRKLGQ
jgi:hypothetical protein